LLACMFWKFDFVSQDFQFPMAFARPKLFVRGLLLAKFGDQFMLRPWRRTDLDHESSANRHTNIFTRGGSF
jgi:hypothetical protein